jgi:hypothetical protein
MSTIPVIYFRSSSYTAWDYCNHRYVLDYTLGFRSPPINNKAEKGSITHKALELLAQYKLAKQEGKQDFYNDELKKTINLEDVHPDYIIELAYNHYVEKCHYDYSEEDFADCKKWMWHVLGFKDGMFSPLKVDVVSPEQHFDFVIEQPWAKYSYNINGKLLEGYLGLKGTLDLTTRRPNNIVELIDWKTGRRSDINTLKEKDWESLHNDPQMRIYHYAATKLYPWASHVFITIFYIQSGGPFTLCFGKDDIKKTEDMIHQRFNEIRNTERPALIYPHWLKCKKLCYFVNHDFNGEIVEYENSICNVMKDEIIQLGMDKVIQKYAKEDSLTSYGSGGGQDDRQ